MNAKRSVEAARWIGPDEPSAPAGAELANEIVFQQLAFEALAMSIVRDAETPRARIDHDRDLAPST